MRKPLIKCPHCGSDNTSLAKPNSDAATPQKNSWQCNKCHKMFGFPASTQEKSTSRRILPVGNNYENISCIGFNVGGYFAGYDQVIFVRGNRGSALCVAHVPMDIDQDDIYIRELTDREWKDLMKELFEILFLHEWKKSYVDNRVCDGTQWEVSIQFSDRHAYTVYGSNAFPALWKDAERYFNRFIDEAKTKPVRFEDRLRFAYLFQDNTSLFALLTKQYASAMEGWHKKNRKYAVYFVEFRYGSKEYCYLSDIAFKKGDYVIVPTGYDNHETTVIITRIEYLRSDEAPYPIEKMKKIIRKGKKIDFYVPQEIEDDSCSDDDVIPFEVNDDASLKYEIPVTGMEHKNRLLDLIGCETIDLGPYLNDTQALTELYLEQYKIGKKLGFTPVFMDRDMKLAPKWWDHFELPEGTKYPELVKSILEKAQSKPYVEWIHEILEKYLLRLDEHDDEAYERSLIEEILQTPSDEQYAAQIKDQSIKPLQIEKYAYAKSDGKKDVCFVDAHDVLALIPTDKSYEVLAWLPIGGYNWCPTAECQVAFAKHMHDAYGAEIMGVSSNCIDLYLPDPLIEKDQVIAAAHDLTIMDDDVYQDMEISPKAVYGKQWLHLWWD